MDRSFRVIAAIADVHIGNKSISHKEYKYQLKHGVIKKLKQLAFLDMIVICGDLLHCQISMNSNYAEVFFWFIDEIISVAREKNAVIRIIKGTKSHDLDQLDTIKFYENYEDINFKVVDDYYTESILNMNLAYIAQEYINEPIKKHFNSILGKRNFYDIIFGHMTIEQTQFSEQNSENIDTHAPVFKLEDLFKCANLIISGHIHVPLEFSSRFYYVGSVLRTAHGEEEPKGWDLIVYDTEEKLYRVDKIINEFTFNFNTLNLDNSFIEMNDIDTIVKHVEDFMKERKTDKLSLKITCIDKKDSTVKIELLKKYFAKNTNITTKFKLMSEKSYSEIESNTKKREIEPYLKEGLTLVERIKIWALVKRNIKLTDEDIIKYITPKQLNREKT